MSFLRLPFSLQCVLCEFVHCTVLGLFCLAVYDDVVSPGRDSTLLLSPPVAALPWGAQHS